MTKDEFVATLTLMGCQIEHALPRPGSLVLESRILWRDKQCQINGWVTFRPQGRNDLDVILYKDAKATRVFVTGKSKVLLKKVVALLEDAAGYSSTQNPQ